MGRWDRTLRERTKKEEAEENEKGDKKNRVLKWGSNPVGSDCASGSATAAQPIPGVLVDLTRLNKIAIQGTPQMVVNKEAICLSRVYSYYYKCNLPLFYV